MYYLAFTKLTAHNNYETKLLHNVSYFISIYLTDLGHYISLLILIKLQKEYELVFSLLFQHLRWIGMMQTVWKSPTFLFKTLSVLRKNSYELNINTVTAHLYALLGSFYSMLSIFFDASGDFLSSAAWIMHVGSFWRHECKLTPDNSWEVEVGRKGYQKNRKMVENLAESWVKNFLSNAKGSEYFHA